MKFALYILCLATAAQADNWPRFRGENGSANAGDTKAPVTWSETGRGGKPFYASAVLANGQLFLRSNRALYCIETGSEKTK